MRMWVLMGVGVVRVCAGGGCRGAAPGFVGADAHPGGDGGFVVVVQEIAEHIVGHMSRHGVRVIRPATPVKFEPNPGDPSEGKVRCCGGKLNRPPWLKFGAPLLPGLTADL